MWPRCPWAKAHAVAPAGGGLDLGGHVPRPARPSNKGDKGELVLRGVPMPTSQSTSSRLPPTLQMGKPRPREGEHFACSHGTQAQPQAWDLLGPALGCSPVLLRATAVGEGLLPPRWDTPPPPPPRLGGSRAVAWPALPAWTPTALPGQQQCAGCGAGAWTGLSCPVGQRPVVGRCVTGAVVTRTAEGAVLTQPSVDAETEAQGGRALIWDLPSIAPDHRHLSLD